MTESGSGPGPGSETWYEDESEPLVRPYTVTGGRTRPAQEHVFDLMSVVEPVPGVTPPLGLLDHARTTVLGLVRQDARPVVEIAADADLPVGALRVLLGDLLEAGLIRVGEAPTDAGRPDVELLQEVIAGLRRL